MSDEQQPYVPAGSTMAELTVKAVVLGVVLAAIMGAANAYLALKAGQTVSATFPAAILALAAFRLPFFRGTILEQNVARAAGTVGEALAAGAIFTIPAFLLVTVNGQRLWTEFDYWQTSLILLIGGILGVLFITLLRRTLAVEAALPFPESKACAAIVRAGQAGATGAKYVFGAMGLGMLIQIFKDGAGLRLFRESVEVFKQLPASVIHHFDSSRAPLGDVQHRGAVAFATPSISPALIGVGYIIGFELSAINFSGGVLAWLVFIPLAFFLDPALATKLSVGGVAPAEGELIFSVWYNIVRPVAVGAMLVGAANTMWGMRASIGQAFAGAFKRSHAGTEKSRLERDLDSRGVLLGIVGLTIPMTWIYWNFTHNLVGAVVAAVVMLVLGFLLSAVGGYLVGLMGGSNQPVSGLTPLGAHSRRAADGRLRRDRTAGRRRGARGLGGRLLRDLRLRQPHPGPEGRASARRHAEEDGDRRDRRHDHDRLRARLSDALAAPGEHQAGGHRHRRPRALRAPGRPHGAARSGHRRRRDALGSDPLRHVLLAGADPDEGGIADAHRRRHVSAVRDHRRDLRRRLHQVAGGQAGGPPRRRRARASTASARWWLPV